MNCVARGFLKLHREIGVLGGVEPSLDNGRNGGEVATQECDGIEPGSGEYNVVQDAVRSNSRSSSLLDTNNRRPRLTLTALSSRRVAYRPIGGPGPSEITQTDKNSGRHHRNPASTGLQVVASRVVLTTDRQMSSTMDAKASTHICPSPVAESAPNEQNGQSPAAYMIVVNGAIPGTMVPVNETGTTLGRSAESSIPLNDITVSRQHAIVVIDGDGGVSITDEGSSNGTFVNGTIIPANRPMPLRDGDRIQLGTTVILKLVRLDPHDERFQRDMFERTVRDTLTGLYNRAYFLEQVAVLAERSAMQGNGLAALMIDIDHFKCINDRYGHVVGDDVLKEVADVIRESTRAEDLVARYGGEEFVVALPVSMASLAMERAERIRCELSERTILVSDDEIQLTVSVGISFNPPGRPRNLMASIMAADQALYQAKASGRNRVVAMPQSPQPGHPVRRSSDSSIMMTAS
jgi:two-component system, cell cycle response regulator